MPHFFIEQDKIKDGFIELNQSEDFFHLTRALRAKLGDCIKFIDKNRVVYKTIIRSIDKKSLRADIISKKTSDRFLKANLCLVQSVLAQDAQNSLVANATQTGVCELYPVISDNSSVSIKNAKTKIPRWEKIAYENFKQCERADFLKIHPVSTLGEVLRKFDNKNILFFVEKEDNTTFDDALSDINPKEKIAIVIGPEGGFSNAEFEYYKNYKKISLTNLIYKAPNAVIAAVSNVVSRIF